MADISPPQVRGPIYRGAEIVEVNAAVGGYEIFVYTDYKPGAAPVGHALADPLGRAFVPLQRSLSENEKVSATQATEGRSSNPSWIAATVEKVPNEVLIGGEIFSPPLVEKPLYECQAAFWVKEVVPGVQITSTLGGFVDLVKKTPTPPRQVKEQTTRGRWFVWVGAPGLVATDPPQEVKAAQGFPSLNFPLPSKDSATEPVKPAPNVNDTKYQLAPPEEASDGAKVLTVKNTLAGAWVRIYGIEPSGGEVEYAVRVGYGGSSTFFLDRPLSHSAPPRAVQWLCDRAHTSPPSDPGKITEAVRDPVIEQPICAGSTRVTVLRTEPGAYVELQVRASGQPTFEGRGGCTAKEGTVTSFDASVKLNDGDQVRVRQGHEGRPPSGWAEAPVGGPPHPQVDVRNNYNPNPAFRVFYGGQAVIFRAVHCGGAREVAHTVRVTPPASSGKPQFEMPLLETKSGYFEAAWQIPLHALNAPPGEYVAHFIIPGEYPPDVSFSIGFSADDIDKILNAHNTCRAAVKVPPLKWSDDLAAEAQAWANHLASDVGKLVHHDGGENLQMWWPIGSYTPVKTVEEKWCGEEKGKFISPCASFGDQCSSTGKWKDVGHYTQVVWAQTKSVGAGLAQDPIANMEFFVCRYDPPGNGWGQPVFG